MSIFDRFASRPAGAPPAICEFLAWQNSDPPPTAWESRRAATRKGNARLDRPGVARTVLRLGSHNERKAPASTGCCADLASGHGPSPRSNTR